MQASAVIEELDVVEDLSPGLIPCVIVLIMNNLIFERAKETLHHRIVITVALAAHAAQHPVLLEHLKVAYAGI